MPYIVQSKRRQFEPLIEQVVDVIRQMESDDDHTTNNTEGNLNFFISAIINRVYGPTSAMRYRDINDVLGLLEGVKQEFYRKAAAKLEDQKEFDNGSVY